LFFIYVWHKTNEFNKALSQDVMPKHEEKF